jgi:hypothetical protein
METKTLTPWEAFSDFFHSLSIADVSWVGVSIFLIYLFFSLSTKQISNPASDWKGVLKWFAVFVLGWLFTFVVFGYTRIASAGSLGFFLLLGAAGLSIGSILMFIRRSDNWYKIVSGCIVIILAFGVFTTIAIGRQALSYAVTFGFVLGWTLGMLIYSIYALKNPDKIQARFNQQDGENPTSKSKWDRKGAGGV